MNRDGTAVIASVPRPRPTGNPEDDSVYGVQTLTGFTALPAPIQHLVALQLQPDW